MVRPGFAKIDLFISQPDRPQFAYAHEHLLRLRHHAENRRRGKRRKSSLIPTIEDMGPTNTPKKPLPTTRPRHRSHLTGPIPDCSSNERVIIVS